jgi:hypothetical protein
MHPISNDTLQLALALGFTGFLAWLWFRKARAQAELLRLHVEGRNRLLERLESPQALLDFAATEVGACLLTPPRLQVAPAASKPEGLRLIQAGLVTLFAGFGFHSTYYIAMNWRAANVVLNEPDAFRRALGLWQWSQVCTWTGSALILCGLLAALLAHLGRKRDARG